MERYRRQRSSLLGSVLTKLISCDEVIYSLGSCRGIVGRRFRACEMSSQMWSSRREGITFDRVGSRQKGHWDATTKNAPVCSVPGEVSGSLNAICRGSPATLETFAASPVTPISWETANRPSLSSLSLLTQLASSPQSATTTTFSYLLLMINNLRRPA